jgi:hypothetical protein
MKNLHAIILSSLFALTALIVSGCSPQNLSTPAPTAEASVGGGSCGAHVCSRYQSCCESAKGPYCTTAACTGTNESEPQAPVTEANFGGGSCGTHVCSRYQSCCDGPHGPYCTTAACTEN